MLLRAAALKNFFALFEMKILAFSLFLHYDAANTARKAFTQADRILGIKQFTHIVTRIDIDALKILEQMKVKIGKKLRTANFNSKFTGS